MTPDFAETHEARHQSRRQRSMVVAAILTVFILLYALNFALNGRPPSTGGMMSFASGLAMGAYIGWEIGRGGSFP